MSESKASNMDPKSKDINVDPKSNNTDFGHTSSRQDYDDVYEAAGYLRGNFVRVQIIDHKTKQDIYSLENTDSIVNFVHQDDINGKSELLEEVKEMMKNENEGKLKILAEDKYNPRGFIVTTASHNLPYKAIFHIKIFLERDLFEEALYRAIRHADNMGIRSIALPTLSDRSLADICLRVLYWFEQRARPCCLHLIDIVPEDKEDYDYYDNKTTEMGEDLWRFDM